MKRASFRRFLLPVLTGLVLVACNATPAPTAPRASVTPSAPAASATPAPTETPTPPPGRLVLAGASISEEIRAAAQSQAQPAGLTVDERAALQPGDLDAGVRAVVLLDPPADLAALQAAAPQAQFVLVSAGGVESSERLSVVRADPARLYFMGGLVTTLLSDDWRAGGLIPADPPAPANAFQNGGRYFCGDCLPGWPLGATFPVVETRPGGTTGADWAAAAASLFDNGKVDSFFVAPEALTPEVVAYLAGRVQFQTEVRVVGLGAPAPELKGQWAASLRPDVAGALAAVLPRALAGQSAGAVDVPVTLTDVNEAVFTAGKVELARKVLADLNAGVILATSP